MRINRAIMALVILLIIGMAQAQEADGKKKGGLFSDSPLTWTIEPILNQYVGMVTRHYNLNEDQENYTRKLLGQRVKGFLGEHEKDARSLLDEYWYYQRSGQLPTPEAAKDWAIRSEPLMAAMRKEIIDGNMAWREVLDEKQRKQHDKDLKIMHQQFDRFDGQMKRWREGKVLPSDIPGVQAKRTAIRTTRRFEDIWEYRVRSFIQAYKLDVGQQQTAQSILREMKDEAARYREKHKDQFDRIEAELGKLSKSDPKQTAEEIEAAVKTRITLQERLADLHRPIQQDMWNELLRRLERIPTDDQRRVMEISRAKPTKAASTRMNGPATAS